MKEAIPVGLWKTKIYWSRIAEEAFKTSSSTVSEDDDCIHVTPKIVLEVEYTQALSGSFREPRIVRVRSDKTAQGCMKTWQ